MQVGTMRTLLKPLNDYNQDDNDDQVLTTMVKVAETEECSGLGASIRGPSREMTCEEEV